GAAPRAEEGTVPHEVFGPEVGVFGAHLAFLVEQPRVPLGVAPAASENGNDESLARVGRQLDGHLPDLTGAQLPGRQLKHSIKGRSVVEHFDADGEPTGLADHAVVAREYVEL